MGIHSLLVIALVSLAAVIGACVADPLNYVTVENRSGSVVSAEVDGVPQHPQVAAGKTESFAVLEFAGKRTYEVRRQNGEVIATRTFTWDEFKDDGIHIIVE